MPRVIPNQKERFDKDELFKKLTQESEVKYSAMRELQHDERKKKFLEFIKEGHSTISFLNTGTNLSLQLCPNAWSENKEERNATQEFVDFNKEEGKVHLKSYLIFNGVCVDWIGWIDLESLAGKARFVFNYERAQAEEKLRREAMEQVKNRQMEYDRNHKFINEHCILQEQQIDGSPLSHPQTHPLFPGSGLIPPQQHHPGVHQQM